MWIISSDYVVLLFKTFALNGDYINWAVCI